MYRKRMSLPALILVAILALSIRSVVAQDEFVFGVVLVGPENDRGWSQSHYEAGLYVQDHIPNTRMVYIPSLNPADTPEATLSDVVTSLVEDSGTKLIFTTSDSFEEDTNTVAEQYPDVTFVNITGSNVLNGAPPNVGNFDGMMEGPHMIAGCAAALASETGSIGYLGALINPETRRLAASSYLGARYCWEKYRGKDAADLTFTVTWIGFWFNIPGVTLDPTEVANSFFDTGSDVVISGIDTTEAIVVAGQRASEGQRTFAIPYDNINGCSEAPDACLGVAYYNWGPSYVDTINKVMDGTWKQDWEWIQPDWSDINNPDTSIVGYLNGDGLPEDAVEPLQKFQDEMVSFMTDPANDGRIFLWQGPLNYQDGTELAPEGGFVDTQDIWFLSQLLEGMTGASA